MNCNYHALMNVVKVFTNHTNLKQPFYLSSILSVLVQLEFPLINGCEWQKKELINGHSVTFLKKNQPVIELL